MLRAANGSSGILPPPSPLEEPDRGAWEENITEFGRPEYLPTALKVEFPDSRASNKQQLQFAATTSATLANEFNRHDYSAAGFRRVWPSSAAGFR